MQWEQSAVDKLDELVRVVRDPFREIIKNSAQTHAERYAAQRQKPHVTLKDAVLGFLRARSHKLNTEGAMLLKEYGIDEKEFTLIDNNDKV
ncbi:MAG TPA: hypothetical protein VMF88_07990 [Bacteroidota bacterium]|nr:hypothetical protein [Bacteroidota bacterium]